MSTTPTPTWRRRMALAAATILATLQVATVAPAIANAEPNKSFLQDYYTECARNAFSSLKGDLLTWNQYIEALSNCCTNLGGIYNERTGDCYLPDQTTIRYTQPPIVTPPTGRAVPPPGANTRAGMQ
jgi:hypothetical protein